MGDEETAPPLWRRVLLSPWVPVVLCLAFITLVLRFYSVPFTTTAIFGAYLVIGIMAPGTLLWRACQRGSGWLAGDLAGGLAVGYVVEVGVYIVTRSVGVPQLVLAWPVAVFAIFLAVPRLRRFWRPSPLSADRTPTWWAWAMAALVGLFMVRSTRFFRSHLMEWPFTAATDADSPFHLALIGEAKHHMPMMTPWVSDERFLYHWFIYPEMAATSWVTGIEPMVLLFRLSLLPMFLCFLILLAAITRKLTGHWWTGPVAVAATYLVLAPDPYGWAMTEGWFGFSATEDGSVFRLLTWTSPTQTLGATIFAAVMLVLVQLLGSQGKLEVARWVLLGLLLAGLAGAKSPYLPLLFGGLGLTGAILLVVKRRLSRPIILSAGLVLVFTVLAQLVLYRGTTQLLDLKPLGTLSWYGTRLAATTGFLGPDAPLWRQLLVAGLTILTWAFIWVGVVGLWRGRRLLDPSILLMISMGVVGATGFLLLSHPGGAEGYLLISARPYLGIAAVVGFAAALGSRVLTRRLAGALAGAVVAGIVVVLAVRALGTPQAPGVINGSYRSAAWHLFWPYLLLVIAAAGAAVAVWWAGRRFTALRGARLALVVAFCTAFGLPSAYDQMANTVAEARSSQWARVPESTLLWPWDTSGRASIISADTARAGRWIREHSQPDDIIATNAHCLIVEDESAPCDNRRFALAAMAERRVLVEGWGFTNSVYVQAAATATAPWFAGYWDEERWQANENAFTAPSAQAIADLRDRYGVRWLVVDTSHGQPSPEISKHASLRFAAGTCAVYEIARG